MDTQDAGTSPKLMASPAPASLSSAFARQNGGTVKLTAMACDRISRLKGVARNHLLAQVVGFRVADKEA
jgi:hypothetical protein